MTIYRIVCAASLLHILALLRMSVTCIAIVRQECRTSYKFLLNAQIHVAHSITRCGWPRWHYLRLQDLFNGAIADIHVFCCPESEMRWIIWANCAGNRIFCVSLHII